MTTIATPEASSILTQSSGIANAVSKAIAPTLPKNIEAKKSNTKDLKSGWMHALIYGETDARKTSTAAHFDKPERTRIILTRRPEQLIPLANENYDYLLVESANDLRYAMQYPEKVWPDWALLPDRTLVLDDVTRAKDMLLEDNEVGESGRELKDMRQVHRGAKDDMQDLLSAVLHKPMHFVCVALAQVYQNNITREEMITPDIPPAMNRMVTTEFEFCFYINKQKWQFLTKNETTVYQAKNDKNVLETHVRTTFAKHKLPLGQENTIKLYEPMDLRAIWERVRNGGK